MSAFPQNPLRDNRDAGARLAEAESKVRLVTSVVEHGYSAVLITDADMPDPRVVYINPAFSQVTGLGFSAMVGRRVSELPFLSAVLARMRAGLPEGARFVEEVVSFLTGRGEHWGEWRVGPVNDASGKQSHWLIILRDITERKRLEKEVLAISDRERQRLGQDLHDGLCQHLAAIEIMSQLLAQKLATRHREASARAAEIAGQVREAITQARLLARGLSPVTLETEGLMSAIRELAANTEKMFGVDCVLNSDVPVQVFDPTDALHIYRIAQEAVSNAIKHGKARRIEISLNRAGHESVLTVKDDGPGLPEELPKSGMGLRIMQHRASILGGQLICRNAASVGVEVVFTFPTLSRAGIAASRDSMK